ncbi:MAG: helix-turn-helix transcriptional regulator [Clostridia bacterium]|nr:helix-turn-helix transcriptional regulator [Clostridia bacterium]
MSDIPVRTIQQYEQNQKNINAAKAETVVKLAKALNCTVEALMEAV